MPVQEFRGDSITAEEFRERCLKPNVPAIIRGVGPEFFDVAKLERRLCPAGLAELFPAHHLFPVYRNEACMEAVHDAEREPETDSHESAAREAEDEWEEGCPNLVSRDALLRDLWGRRLIDGGRVAYYLKDWHAQTEIEAAHSPPLPRAGCGAASPDALYRVPDYLGGDWMDAFCAALQSHERVPDGGSNGSSPLVGFGDGVSCYRFAYIGPPGTWTPLHCDVFGTYSWSLNVCGTKLWFFPATPEDNARLHAAALPNRPPPPDVRVLTGAALTTVEQHSGDLVFVPSNYFHQVHNVAGTAFPLPPSPSAEVPLVIAVNHNWCNEHCIGSMTRTFLDNVASLRRLTDLADLEAIYGADPGAWRRHLETSLLSGTNWSFASMRCFLQYCATTQPGAASVVAPLAEAVRLAEEHLLDPL